MAIGYADDIQNLPQSLLSVSASTMDRGAPRLVKEDKFLRLDMQRSQCLPPFGNRFQFDSDWTGKSLVPPRGEDQPLERQAPPKATPEEKIERELAIFQKKEQMWRQQYGQQYVAVHNGVVIDTSEDLGELIARLDARARQEGPIALCWLGTGPQADAEDVDMYLRFDSPVFEETEE
ncbi:hypothetical protein JXA47_07305 [Candidatus Sumerlaeota bacterium]|nr:hypothetical protein [Candidatus Sumerlaeota bacterium]